MSTPHADPARVGLPDKQQLANLAVYKLWTRCGVPVDWSEDSIKRLYAEIGTRIRSARKQAVWSQFDLAHAVGLTRSSIANIEAGRQHAPVHVVVLIAHTLSAPVETLLPSGPELDSIATFRTPTPDLEGQPDSTHDFVTTALRRATGGVSQ